MLEFAQVSELMSKTILVVEDEVFVRLDIADFLRDQGFEVLEASNAGQALTHLERGARIDLVFTDVRMPGEMDGIGLAKFLKTHHPSIKIIVTSGHVHAHELPQELAFVDKPYDRGRIVERIKAALK